MMISAILPAPDRATALALWCKAHNYCAIIFQDQLNTFHWWGPNTNGIGRIAAGRGHLEGQWLISIDPLSAPTPP